MRVAYVDGDPDRRERTAARLERAVSASVRAMEDPRRAIEAASEGTIEGLVTVFRLPGWTGLELAGAVRRVSDVPVVVSAPATEPAAGKLSAVADAAVRRGEGIPADRLADAVEGVLDSTADDGAAGDTAETASDTAAAESTAATTTDSTDDAASDGLTSDATTAEPTGDERSDEEPAMGVTGRDSQPNDSGVSTVEAGSVAADAPASDGSAGNDGPTTADDSASDDTVTADDSASDDTVTADHAEWDDGTTTGASDGWNRTDDSSGASAWDERADRTAGAPTRAASGSSGESEMSGVPTSGVGESGAMPPGGLAADAPWPVALTRIGGGTDTPHVVAVNAAFSETFGVQPAAIRDEPLDEYVVPADESAGAAGINRASTDGEPFTVEVERETAEGRQPFLLSVVPAGGAVTDGGTTVGDAHAPPASDETTGESASGDGPTDDAADDVTADDAATDDTGTDDATAPNVTTTDDGELLVWAVYADVGEEVRQRERVESLHEVALALSRETEPSAVYERAVEAVTTVVPADRGAIYSDRDGTLHPVAGDDRAGPSGVVERVAEEGDGYLVTERGQGEPVGPDRATIAVPVGDHGVLRAGSDDATRFEKFDLHTLHLLAAHTAAALDRTRRESTLRRRERQLERHNDRLDRFAGLVSHDLRSPLEVARGNIELGMLQDDDARLEAAIDALDRADDLIDDMLTFARTGEHVTDEETVVVAEVAHMAWTEEFDQQGELLVDTSRTIEADEERLRQLFENLFRNAIEHGCADDESITVRVLDTPAGIAVADDGVGLPTQLGEDLFDPGVSTGEDGTGYGLSVVREIAAAHGWSVSAGESDPGGARFDICIE